MADDVIEQARILHLDGIHPSDTWWAGTVGHVKGAAGTMGGIIGGTEDPRGSAGGNQILNNGSAR